MSSADLWLCFPARHRPSHTNGRIRGPRVLADSCPERLLRVRGLCWPSACSSRRLRLLRRSVFAAHYFSALVAAHCFFALVAVWPRSSHRPVGPYLLLAVSPCLDLLRLLRRGVFAAHCFFALVAAHCFFALVAVWPRSSHRHVGPTCCWRSLLAWTLTCHRDCAGSACYRRLFCPRYLTLLSPCPLSPFARRLHDTGFASRTCPVPPTLGCGLSVTPT